MRRDGKLLHVDRVGHLSVSSFFNTDETEEEYNASEPVNDFKRWLDPFCSIYWAYRQLHPRGSNRRNRRRRSLPDMLAPSFPGPPSIRMVAFLPTMSSIIALLSFSKV